MKKPKEPDMTEIEKQLKDSNDRITDLIDAQNRAADAAQARAEAAAGEQSASYAAMRASSDAQLRASEERIKKMEGEATKKEEEEKKRIRAKEAGRRKGRPTLLTEEMLAQEEKVTGKKKTLLGE